MLILLSSTCTTKNPIQARPDAQIGQPYSVKIDFSNGYRTQDFKVTITPENSGLSASGVPEPYDETIISGAPKVKQDISIKIDYFSPEFNSGFLVMGIERVIT